MYEYVMSGQVERVRAVDDFIAWSSNNNSCVPGGSKQQRAHILVSARIGRIRSGSDAKKLKKN